MIADDHPFYRQGLARLLRESDVDVVAEVPNGEAAIRAAQETEPDVVVMDLNMPGVSGFDATRRLVEKAPDSRVLVLSVSALEADVTDAFLAGAIGYVLKDAPMEEVIAAVRAAAAGDSVVSPRIATMLVRRVRESMGEAVVEANLSDREREVLSLLAEGRSNVEIAKQLLITPSTVAAHVSSILTKLQVENRVQAAVQAVRGRLV